MTWQHPTKAKSVSGAPTAGEVPWTFKDRNGSKTTVKAQTWFAARKAAAIILGSCPEHLECITNGY